MLRYTPAALEITGLATLAAAAYLVALPLGLAVSGISLLLIGYQLERSSK